MMIKASVWSWPALLPLLLAVAMVASQKLQVKEGAAQAAATEGGEMGLRHKRPIFFSEAKLRAVVEATNIELRQLKRDFMKQMTDIYLRVKLDPALGYERARDHQDWAASANVLVAEEFATMAIKKHIIERRLLTGLKLAFVKFLPMQTLINLYRRYKSFEWLKDQEQVELRPRFPQAKENQFVILYSLIELRARLRAADDVYALTAENARRVLQVVQWYLVESNNKPEVSNSELSTLAQNAKVVLQFHNSEVLEWRLKLNETYAIFLAKAKPLAEQIGGERDLINFIDRLIDVEALDIDLNQEAASLVSPPTINEQMILNVQKRWIPWYVLKSVEEDRQLLIEQRKRVMHLLKPDNELPVEDWSERLLDYLCHNDVAHYGANYFGR